MNYIFLNFPPLGDSVLIRKSCHSGRGPWLDRPFDKPFDRLTVLSKVEGLTTLSEVEGESRSIVSYQNHSGSPATFGGG